mgnify:CR=1 FL=1
MVHHYNINNCRDLCFGGVVQSDESYSECAKRELLEELNLEISLEEVGKFYFECENNWLFGMVYFAIYDGDIRITEDDI